MNPSLQAALAAATVPGLQASIAAVSPPAATPITSPLVPATQLLQTPTTVKVYYNPDDGLVPEDEEYVEGSIEFKLTRVDAAGAPLPITPEMLEGFIIRLLQIYPAAAGRGKSGSAEVDRITNRAHKIRYAARDRLSEVVSDSKKRYIVELEDSDGELFYAATNNIQDFAYGFQAFPLQIKEVRPLNLTYLKNLEEWGDVRYLDTEALNEEDNELAGDADSVLDSFEQDLTFRFLELPHPPTSTYSISKLG